MGASSARAIALAALRAWRKSQRRADEIISERLRESNLAANDRAFAIELFYGVLRNRKLLNFWISCLRDQGVDPDLRDLLQLGLYQVLIAKTSPHAAVNETVNLAAAPHRGVVNGVLRSAVRASTDLASRAEAQPLAIRTSHPEFLVDRWQKNLGVAIAEKLCHWDNTPPPLYGRINQLKISREDFLTSYAGAEPVPGISNFVRFAQFPETAVQRGHCYLQDPSTRLACELLKPSSGESILDACAAPGGKTAYLAELMANTGVIVACDRRPERLRLVDENVKRLGVTIGRTVEHDWLAKPPLALISNAAPYDAILVDAPCSNTGVMRRRVDLRWRLQPGEFDRMANEQIAILLAIFPLLKPGGRLIYSTCSLEAEENEQLIARLTKRLARVQLVETTCSSPWQSGFDGAFVASLRNAG